MVILPWLARHPPHLAIRKNKCCSITNILADTQEHRHAFGDTPKPKKHSVLRSGCRAAKKEWEKEGQRGERGDGWAVSLSDVCPCTVPGNELSPPLRVTSREKIEWHFLLYILTPNDWLWLTQRYSLFALSLSPLSFFLSLFLCCPEARSENSVILLHSLRSLSSFSSFLKWCHSSPGVSDILLLCSVSGTL